MMQKFLTQSFDYRVKTANSNFIKRDRQTDIKLLKISAGLTGLKKIIKMS